MNNLTKLIASKIDIEEKYVNNIIKLLDEGSTIAFIARYRKDLTGNATDETLLKFQEIYEYSHKLLKRREEISNILKQKDSLTQKIDEELEQAQSLRALEDIYEPYKGSKNTRADNAVKNGLTDLANIISTMKYTIPQIEQKARKFLNKDVKTVDEAVSGAKDIIALRYSQETRTKEALRKNIQSRGILVTKPAKSFDKDGLYKDLADINQKASYMRSHRLLAVLRGVNEKQLSMKIELDEDYIIEGIKKYRIRKDANSSSKLVIEAYIDGLKRLLLPALKREFVANLKEKAGSEAIELFGKNLGELLLTPPLVNQIILGMDPGYKTGCKCAVIDKEGNYLDSCVVYLLSEEQKSKASKTIQNIIKKHNVTAIAIGNGTASKETASFISDLKEKQNLKFNYAVVSEIGASVYSASKIAQQEYPDLDVTIRGAISIAQRLRDPISALVKIDPKSLGLGQYQHDLNQKELANKLAYITENLVNKVGVDINSASYKLLSYLSGISERLAKNIIEFRKRSGAFRTKRQLMEVSGLGQKAFEQSVGFVRIKDGESFFDNTGIHPESYDVANYIKNNFDLENISNDDIKGLSQKFEIGFETLKDIVFELKKPGYDIREELEQVSFCEQIKDIEELKEGDEVNGIVRNITDFGAFVDIGLKNDALLHISKISHKRVSHPSDVLRVNQQLKNIKIDTVDLKRSRIGLSLV